MHFRLAIVVSFIALFANTSLLAASLILEPPPKVESGFTREITPACTVETNISPAFTKKVATMVRNAEEKFYKLFKLTPDLMNGVSKEKFDVKANIPGDVMRAYLGLRPWVDIRVYKSYEQFADEWFDHRGVKDPKERANTGLPGAYFSISRDYNEKLGIRRIRSYVDNRDDDELERTLLHEMGHLFMISYMLEIGGDPPKGQESQKRGMPAWLGEGTAQLFENLWSSAPSSKKARVRQQAMIYEAVNIGDSYPFKEFINITNAHNLAAVAHDPLKATINYAQSASVMDYMVNVDGARFFNFLQNLREANFKNNLMSRDKNHIPELYSLQDEAFRKAFVVSLEEVEGYWKKHVKKTMEDALKKQPELHYWIGEYYLRRGRDKANDLKKAEEQFTIAMKEAPNKGEGYLGVGRLNVNRNDYAAALPLLEKAVKLMPKDDEALYYLGAAQLNTDSPAEAVASFNASLALSPRSARALHGLGTAALRAKQFDKAIQAFDDAYASSRNAIFLFEKGHAAFCARKYQIAQTGFANFVGIYPNQAQGHFWYGLAAYRLGQKDFAIKELEQAVALMPKNADFQEFLKAVQAGQNFLMDGEEPPPQAVAVAKKEDENPFSKSDTAVDQKKDDKQVAKPKNKVIFRPEDE